MADSTTSPPRDVQTFNEGLRERVRNRHSDLLTHLRDEGTLPDEIAGQIADVVDDYKRSFSPSDGSARNGRQHQ